MSVLLLSLVFYLPALAEELSFESDYDCLFSVAYPDGTVFCPVKFDEKGIYLHQSITFFYDRCSDGSEHEICWDHSFHLEKGARILIDGKEFTGAKSEELKR